MYGVLNINNNKKLRLDRAISLKQDLSCFMHVCVTMNLGMGTRTYI